MGDRESWGDRGLTSALALVLLALSAAHGFAGPVELPVQAGIYGPESAADGTKPICDPRANLIEIDLKGIKRNGAFCPWVSITNLDCDPESGAPECWDDFEAVTGCFYSRSPHDPRPNSPTEPIVYMLSPRAGPPAHILFGEEENAEMFMLCQAS